MKALSVCLEVNEVQPRGGYGIVDNEGGINWCLQPQILYHFVNRL